VVRLLPDPAQAVEIERRLLPSGVLFDPLRERA
jgi:hypothetical protein